MEFLTPDNLLTHPLWIDLDNASTILQEKVQRGEISAAEGVTIQNMIYHGFAMVDLDGVDQIITALDKEMEDLWQNPPFDLAFASPKHEKPVPMDEGLAAYPRSPGVRLLDIHSHSASARQLYLNPQLHHLCSLILDGQAIATQTLYFEYGSTQRLHRDPWYVNHSPRTHLFAVWIALEDIHPDSGPLNYVSGSHKLPFHRFHTNDIVFHDPRLTQTDRQTAFRHMQEQIRSSKYPPVAALPKRGQAFLWHGSLIHGGSPVINPALTRRSLVIHFGRSDTHHKRSSGVTHQNITRVFSTEKKYTSASGELGWVSPLEGMRATDFGEQKQTAATAALVKPSAKPDAKPQHCNICGGSAFGPGPKGRSADTGAPPCCQQCGSLERQRIVRTMFLALPLGFLDWRRGLQFSSDPAVCSKQFRSFEVSEYGRQNSLDIQAIDRSDGSYDFISLNHVLEFVPDDVKGFDELARLLSPRGIIEATFSSPLSRQVCVDYTTPFGPHAAWHLYACDVRERFNCAGHGLTMLAIEGGDPCTGAREVVHFFLKDKDDAIRITTWLQMSLPDARIVG